MVTAFLPLYITYEMGYPKTYVGLANTLSLLFAGLICPFLGCIPDRTGRTKLYTLLATGLCVLFTSALSGFSGIGGILAVFFLANVAYQVAMVFYNALLPTVASPVSLL